MTDAPATSREIADHYRALGLQPGASPDDVRQAYRRLARDHHPDLVPDDRQAEARRRMAAINAAYSVLRNYQPPPEQPAAPARPGTPRATTSARPVGGVAARPQPPTRPDTAHAASATPTTGFRPTQGVATAPAPDTGVAAAPEGPGPRVAYTPVFQRVWRIRQRKAEAARVAAQTREQAPAGPASSPVGTLFGVLLPMLALAWVLCLLGMIAVPAELLLQPHIRVAFGTVPLGLSFLLVGLPLWWRVRRRPRARRVAIAAGAAVSLLLAVTTAACVLRARPLAQSRPGLALTLSKPGMLFGHRGSREAAAKALDTQAEELLGTATARAPAVRQLPEGVRELAEGVEEGVGQLDELLADDPERRRQERMSSQGTEGERSASGQQSGVQPDPRRLRALRQAEALAQRAARLRGYAPLDGVLDRAVRERQKLTRPAPMPDGQSGVLQGTPAAPEQKGPAPPPDRVEGGRGPGQGTNFR
jgi:hypothetical protein